MYAHFDGAVSEWLKGPHWKCGVRVTVPRVRIPPAPVDSVGVRQIHSGHDVVRPILRSDPHTAGLAPGAVVAGRGTFGGAPGRASLLASREVHVS